MEVNCAPRDKYSIQASKKDRWQSTARWEISPQDLRAFQWKWAATAVLSELWTPTSQQHPPATCSCSSQAFTPLKTQELHLPLQQLSCGMDSPGRPPNSLQVYLLYLMWPRFSWVLHISILSLSLSGCALGLLSRSSAWERWDNHNHVFPRGSFCPTTPPLNPAQKSCPDKARATEKK